MRPRPSDLPPIELDENTPVGSLYPEAGAGARATRCAPRLPRDGAGPRQRREPARLAAHRPQNTLVSNRDEADDLRLRIAAPGMPADDVEMDLEEVDDFDHPTPARLLPGRAPDITAPDTTAPEPVLQPERAGGATEFEVPIDIEVAPGTTRISLNIKLLLSLRRR